MFWYLSQAAKLIVLFFFLQVNYVSFCNFAFVWKQVCILMGDIRICHFSSALTCVHKLLLPRQSESYWWWSPDRAKSPPHWLSLTHSCSPRLCRWETGEKNKTQTPLRRKYIWSDSHIAALRDVVDGKLGRETFSSGCCCLFQPPNFCG